MRRGVRCGPVLGIAGLSCAIAGCPGQAARTAQEQRAAITALEQERARLQRRLGELLPRDPRLEGLPQTGVAIGVPTSLAQRLIEKVVAGFVDQVRLRLANISVHKDGTIRKVVTLGRYDLDVTVTEVKARLKTARPMLTFGGNAIALRLPVSLAEGTGRAKVRFVWDGRNVSGMVCGDMEVERDVDGTVKPLDYPVAGTVTLAAAGGELVAQPRFPAMQLKLEIEPSQASWDAVQAVLDEKGGVCGFVLDRVDVMGAVRGVVARGFNVRLPTEKVKAMAIPVAIAPSVDVRGHEVELGLTMSNLAITKAMIWLGVDVAVREPGSD